jgi:peptide-methionine (S)-S-oxide reductase
MIHRYLTVFSAFLLTIGMAAPTWAQSTAKAKSNPTNEVQKAEEPKRDEEKSADPKTKDDVPTEEKKAQTPKLPKIERATFGGGCFWCTEAVFERIPGVQAVISGYAGGNVPNPSYQDVCTGLTGHAEVIQVVFDPSLASYESLIKLFFKSHDPTTLNSQGPDFGTQYRSIILFETEEQKQTAMKVYKELTAAKVYRKPIVTQLVPLTTFYPAEAYHQDYYRNHSDADYSQIYIAPKLKKLKLR